MDANFKLKEFTAEASLLIEAGWLTAAQIIQAWNAEHGCEEHPTIAGQLLAREGLHLNKTLRTPKVAGKSCLYSPKAQAIIAEALGARKKQRELRQRYLAFLGAHLRRPL